MIKSVFNEQIINVSIVSVLNDPTLEFEFSCISNHSISEPNLSHFVVEEDRNVEGETWDSEMWEWNLSSSQGSVHEWNVQEDGNEGGFEEQTKVSKTVDHTLLREGQVSSLADHEISPLDANYRYEIARLSELKSLGGVANWVPLGSVGLLVELWKRLITWIISALNPCIWSSVFSIEQSDINLSVLFFIPSKSIPLGFVGTVLGVSIK